MSATKTAVEAAANRLPAFMKAPILDAQKALETLVNRLNGLEPRKRLDQLQNRVIETVGVASKAQVQQISKELAKLSKKLDLLSGKKSAAQGSEPRN